jgi:urease accessory protein
MSSRNPSLRFCLAALAILTPTLAFAHGGVHGSQGFLSGFSHPVGGIDHILAMVAVGIFAASLGGRALWAVPLAFMGFMLVGGALGILGFPLPLVELGIALSIVVLGIAVAVQWDWPVMAAMAMAGLFAIFHGHAHGTEMPLDASELEYALGFVTATGLLHLAGIGLGVGIGKAGQLYSNRIAQAGGAAVAIAGIGVLTGIV